MANTLDPMDLKQIITLHLDGLSNRKIGTTLGISRNTVNSYMRLFGACDRPLKELLALDNGVDYLQNLGLIFSSHFFRKPS
ncbi:MULTISPECIES: LuxR C-terminal-related transcriptional regulator [Arenibacter]|uniref:LuxR C-terminal-related transcriptional regulator n=1 Tax=Arenibacter TaxID=178469 RepID=UPI001EFEDA96|nr:MULTISPECIES: helix-turn-helix domain-containing protein [Arenibacter]